MTFYEHKWGRLQKVTKTHQCSNVVAAAHGRQFQQGLKHF